MITRVRLSLTVMALLLVSCQQPNPRTQTALNTTAVLAGNIPTDPMGWTVITSEVNPAAFTMSTLFGNESAVKYVRSERGTAYPSGAVLSMVTWTQQEDARWFGAKIPSRPTSVEFVSAHLASDGGVTYDYRNFAGAPLREAPVAAGRVRERIVWLLSRRAAVMP